MWMQQILVVVLCISCTVQQVKAVVNKATFQETVNNVESTNNKEIKSEIEDSSAAESKLEANRRDAPVLSDSYGVPIPPGTLNAYGPPPLPAPVYGVPNHPSNNVVYPPPPPDIPPAVSTSFVNGNNLDLPSGTYGVPNGRPGIPFEKYGPPPSLSSAFGPPPAPPIRYGPPKLPKPFISKPFKPRPIYGPPNKPLFFPKSPKPIYGPPKYYRKPKPSYGPPKLTYGPPGISLGPSNFNSGPPKNVYGPPKYVISSPHNHYGPPDPVPHPPPPGVPAPPTPPEIKYDGWKPIPGLVSRPPSDSYGVPHGEPHGTGDLLLNGDFTPPPVGVLGDNQISIESHSNVNVFGSSSHGAVSDSYGAPLNAVTGSGQIVTSSVGNSNHQGDIQLGLSAVGLNSGQNDNLAVIKSIGYEVLQQSNGQYYVNNNGGVHSSSLSGKEIYNEGISGGIGNSFHSGGDVQFSGATNNNYLPPVSGNIHLDSYGAPPSDSYSISGPYAAAHSYKSSGLSSSKFNSLKQFKKYPSYKPEGGLSNAATHGGLVPPSGYYGVPPSGQYGTPLIDSGSFLNALEINPPQHPVVHREPVPNGILQSLGGRGHHHKDAKGLVHNIHLAQSAQNQYNAASTYIPPPVPDTLQPLHEQAPQISTDLTLPSLHTHTSFRDSALSHSDSYSNSINIQGAQTAALTSYQVPSVGISEGYQASSIYQAPLNNLDGVYGVPVTSFGVAQENSHGASVADASHAGINIAIAHNQGVYPFGYAGIPHDCSAYKSQPLPDITYGVPQQNGYATSLALTSNIGGNYQGAAVPITYGVPDLQSAHSHIVTSDQTVNNIEVNDKESFAKSLVPGAEVIPSQSIDFHSVPIQVPNTYAVQIQSSENTHNGIASGQYLNDALLQSVLNAVEQTKANEQNGQESLQLSGSGPGVLQQDLDSQHSIRNEVYTSTNALNGTSSQSEDSGQDDNTLSLIGNKEIALYFNKNMGKNTRLNEEADSASNESQKYDNFGFFEGSQVSETKNNSTETA